ncbi:hypothetical protein FYJ72_03985 [Prevotella copri]|uniref:Uncharacterized protein n=1 Tax=Segatella copri TaxID=165179 RepID=A0A6I2TWR6_9BACT|nr:hypothetical protein [Segatella copri]MST76863.1 hypothetical protein [Segatella copri]
MFNDYNKEFQFLINVSREAYQKKEDARACLVYAGAKAIQRNKMAFVQKEMTIPQFLDLATTGHTFCNLFNFNPKKEYWIKNSKGQSYQTYPLYCKGENKGAMKIQFKSDKYFQGSQAVFVDVDYTSYKTVPEYLAKLSMQPTCVYMSFSDGIEKSKVKSRRFRLVYVFDEILDQQKFLYVSKSINDQIIADTGEDMEDDCGTRMSQYMNGVYGNDEKYEFDWIYTPRDFCVSGDYYIKPYIEETKEPEPEPEDDPMKFDNQMLNDMESMEYKTFMHLYSTRYKYIYRTEKDAWEDGLYQFTDENYLQLYYYREKVKDGEHRRKKLFWAACLRRLINPEIDPNTLLFNLYVDRERFYDNSDEVMSIACLTRRVRKAFEMTYEELQRFCGATVAYWKANRPYRIFKSGIVELYGSVTCVMKIIRYKELDVLYDRSISLKENIERGLTVPQSTLYRYCADRMIDTNPNRPITEREKRQQKRDLKQEKIALFQKLYDPDKSIRHNKEYLADKGLNISVGTIAEWSKLYYKQDFARQIERLRDNTCFDVDLPVLNFDMDILANEKEPYLEETKSYEMYNWELPPLYWENNNPCMCFS